MKNQMTKTKKEKILELTKDEKFLGLRDLAEKAGLSESFIRKLKTEKRLPHYKVGGRVLFKFSEFNSWMQTQRV